MGACFLSAFLRALHLFASTFVLSSASLTIYLFTSYLPSESSFFVFPNKIIMKTCGTTLNLLGLPRILSIAKDYAGLDSVYRCFYSRKSFMFPEYQIGPHKGGWSAEVGFLDDIFGELSSPSSRTWRLSTRNRV